MINLKINFAGLWKSLDLRKRLQTSRYDRVYSL